MEKILKNPNVQAIGVGIVAFIGVRFLLKQMDKKSNASGAASGTKCPAGQYVCGDTGQCMTTHECWEAGGLGGAEQDSAGNTVFVPRSRFSGACGCGA